MERLYKIILVSLFAIIAIVVLALSCWALVCDRFIVKGASMFPTCSSGDVVWVNKLCMGARIYTDFDFTSPKLESFRMPGFGRLAVGDLVVFNVPFGREHDKIEFKINYVYAKRCLGCPGDVVGIRDSFYYNENLDGDFGHLGNQMLLRDTPDSLIPDFALAAYPYVDGFGWTIRNLGPLVVPAEGMEVVLDEHSVHLYAHAIEYETGFLPFWDGQRCHIGDKVYDKYRFSEDYYYFVGDNVLDSKDSRYFGFVPSDFVIGKIAGY